MSPALQADSSPSDPPGKSVYIYNFGERVHAIKDTFGEKVTASHENQILVIGFSALLNI